MTTLSEGFVATFNTIDAVLVAQSVLQDVPLIGDALPELPIGAFRDKVQTVADALAALGPDAALGQIRDAINANGAGLVSAAVQSGKLLLTVAASSETTGDAETADFSIGGTGLGVSAQIGFTPGISEALHFDLLFDPATGQLSYVDRPGNELTITVAADLSIVNAAGSIGPLDITLQDVHTGPEASISLGIDLPSLDPAQASANLSGTIDVRDRITLDLGDSLPSVQGDLAVNWQLGGSGAATPTVELDDVKLKLGDLMGSVADALQPLSDLFATRPFKQFYDALTTPLPIIDDGIKLLGQIDDFDLVPGPGGDGQVSALDLLAYYLKANGDPAYKDVVDLTAVISLLHQIDAIKSAGGDLADTYVSLGSFKLTDDPNNPFAALGSAAQLANIRAAAEAAVGTAFGLANDLAEATGDDLKIDGKSVGEYLQGVSGDGPDQGKTGIYFPVFENPSEILKFIFPGAYPEDQRNAEFFRIDLVENYALDESKFFGYGPFVFNIAEKLYAGVDISVGYDSFGLLPGNSPEDGIFVRAGNHIHDNPHAKDGAAAYLDFLFAAGAGLGVALGGFGAGVLIEGGISGDDISIFLEHGGYRPGIGGPLFSGVTGKITARLNLLFKVDAGLFSVEHRETLVSETIVDFDDARIGNDKHLASMLGGASEGLYLNAGTRFDQRLIVAAEGTPITEDNLDNDEVFKLANGSLANGAVHTVKVSAFGITEQYGDPTGVVYADMGQGHDILAAAPDFFFALRAAGNGGDDSLSGGAAADTLFGDSADDADPSQQGNDILSGGAGDDVLHGGPGDDLLDGGDGSDRLVGGDGHDSVTYEKAAAAIALTPGTIDGSAGLIGSGAAAGDRLSRIEQLIGSAFGDNIVAGVQPDGGGYVIEGRAGNDSLTGGAGDDLLIGGVGADALTGGAGFDGVSYLDSKEGVEIDLAAGTGAGGDAAGDSFAAIEMVQGSMQGDTLRGTAGDDILDGLDGDDILDSRGGEDIVFGGNGADTVFAGAEGGLADGGAGHDLLSYEHVAAAGVTVNLLTGAGPGGQVIAGAIALTIDPATGEVRRNADGLPETVPVPGHSSFEDLTGSNQADMLTGDAGGNAIHGLGGTDDIRGGDGNDMIDGGGATDRLFGEAGDDAIGTDAGDDFADGGSGKDSITGGGGANELLGRDGDDLLIGMAGNDRLDGDTGNDFLAGGGNGDALDGDDGTDDLAGGSGDDSVSGGNGDDILFGDARAHVVVRDNENDALTGVSDNDIGVISNWTAARPVEFRIDTAAAIAGGAVLTIDATDIDLDVPDANGADELVEVLINGHRLGYLAGASDTTPFRTASPWIDHVEGAKSSTSFAVDSSWLDPAGKNLIQVRTANAINSDHWVFSIDLATLMFNVDPIDPGQGGKDTLQGGAGADLIVGGADDDQLDGGEGDDTLQGDDPNPHVTSGGNDHLVGGAGDDILIGGAGTDILDAGSGKFDAFGGRLEGKQWIESVADNDLLIFDRSAETTGYALVYFQPKVDSPAGIWRGSDGSTARGISQIFFYGGSGGEAIGTRGAGAFSGAPGDDKLYGGGGQDAFYSGSGNDLLDGGDGNDTLDASDGNDHLFGGAGADYLDGGAGDDVIETGLGGDFQAFGRTGNDRIVGGDDGNTLYGQEGDDTLYGMGGNDSLIGGNSDSGIDTLYGGDGDDYIDPGLGVDTIDGGAGFDHLVINRSHTMLGVSFYLNGAAGSDGTTAINVELLDYTGGAGNDIVVSGGSNDHLYGQSGDDTLSGLDGIDGLYGAEGNDHLLGGAGADYLDGGAGDDVIETGLGGDFQAYGRTGNDSIVGGDDGNTLYGQEGDDTLYGMGGNDSLIGGNSDSGNDTLDGGAGADRLEGGAGNDVLVIDNNGDMAIERANEGIDTVKASIGYTLTTEVENLILQGSANVDGTGNAKGNQLTGNAGSNAIDGAAGDDMLTGGAGNDTLHGGTGTDTAVFSGALADYVVRDLGNGTVTITDGRPGGDGTDTIDGFELLQFGDRSYTLAAALAAPPVAANDSLGGIVEATSLNSGHASGSGNVLGNDGTTTASLTVVGVHAGVGGAFAGVGGATHVTGSYGDLAIGPDGGFHYMLDNARAVTNALGDGDTVSDIFTYQVADANGRIAAAQLTVTIAGAADPVATTIAAGADRLVVTIGQPSLLGAAVLLGNDMAANGEALTVTAIENVSGAAVDLIDGKLAITASGAAASFDYSVSGVDGAIATGHVVVAGVPATAGRDKLVGGTATAADLAGLDGYDLLTGTAGADRLDGGSGSDRLDGGAGADLMIGGIGNDSYYVDDSDDVIVEQSVIDPATGRQIGGNDIVYARVSFALPDDLEGLRLVGRDSLVGTGNDLANTILGNAGADTLDGGAGNDHVHGGAAADTLAGGDGNDIVYGYGGSDSFDGGAGADMLRGGNGDDRVAAGDGNDVLVGDAGADLLRGDAGNDRIYGGEGNDDIDGGQNDDDVRAGGGNDIVAGGDGNDLLLGEAGNDRIAGGRGRDTLYGGAGTDMFVFMATGDSTLAAKDVIRDLDQAAHDRIDLSAIDAIAGGGDDAFRFVGAFGGQAGELTSTGIYPQLSLVQGDVDGDGTADFAFLVAVAGGTPLTTADFVL